MGSLTISNKILERYFGFLVRFDDETKKKLIVKLTDSLELKENENFDLDTLFGAWKDERTTNEILAEIKNSRIEPKTINNL